MVASRYIYIFIGTEVAKNREGPRKSSSGEMNRIKSVNGKDSARGNETKCRSSVEACSPQFFYVPKPIKWIRKFIQDFASKVFLSST